MLWMWVAYYSDIVIIFNQNNDRAFPYPLNDASSASNPIIVLRHAWQILPGSQLASIICLSWLYWGADWGHAKPLSELVISVLAWRKVTGSPSLLSTRESNLDLRLGKKRNEASCASDELGLTLHKILSYNSKDINNISERKSPSFSSVKFLVGPTVLAWGHLASIARWEGKVLPERHWLYDTRERRKFVRVYTQ